MPAPSQDTPNTGSWSLGPARWPDSRSPEQAEPQAHATAQSSPVTGTQPQPVDPLDQPTQATPVIEHPLAQPASPRPATAHPASPQPATARPATAQPSNAQPANAQPSNAQPANAQPATEPAQPTGSLPTAEYRPPAGPPSRIYVPRPVYAEAPPSQAIVMPPPPRAPRRRLTWLYVVAAVLIVAVIVGAGALVLHNRAGQKAAAPTNNTSTEAATFDVNLSGFSTTGTNFRAASGGFWTTQTYTTPDFGGLKPGVGLVIDLGKAQRVTEIDFTAKTGPLSVELRRADSLPSSLDDWKKVSGTSKSASGTTSLPVTDNQKHQYWMIWVTELGSGNKAVIGDVKAHGTT